MTHVVIGILIAAGVPLLVGTVYFLNALFNDIWRDNIHGPL